MRWVLCISLLVARTSAWQFPSELSRRDIALSIVGASYLVYAGSLVKGLQDDATATAAARKELLSVVSGNAHVLEVGVGDGPNFAYMQRGTRVTALDPAVQRHVAKLQAKAAASGVSLTLVNGVCEALPFPSNSFDDAVCTLVLCSVQDPKQSVRELSRVLRPNGRLHFMEHVIAKDRFLQIQQRALNSFQEAMADNCHLTRDTAGVLRDAVQDGLFSLVDMRNVDLPSRGIISHRIIGTATK